MSAFSAAFLADLRARTPVKELVERRVELKRSGRNWKACCPFHNERTPSFYIYPDQRYHCFGCGADGDALDFAMRTQGLSFPDTVAQLAQEAGLELPDAEPAEPVEAPFAEARAAAWKAEDDKRRAQRDAEAAANEARRTHWASTIAGQGSSIGGTPGEWYLNRARGIPTPDGGWPDCLRWHAGHNAVVALATLPDGTVRATQRIHLDEDGEKLSGDDLADAGLESAKITNGVLAGAAVRLPGDPVGPLLIAEGVETGLSAWAVTGHECWVMLGTVGRAELPSERRVVVLGEDMPRFHPAAKQLREALARWRRGGHQIAVAMPWAKRRCDKSDLNDVLRAEGPEAVIARIERALCDEQATPVDRLSVDVARDLLDRAIGSFIDATLDWTRPVEGLSAAAINQPPPIAHAVKVTVGGGKTHYELRHVARALTVLRARDDKRNIAVAVPTHALGDQQAADFADLEEVKALVSEAEAAGLTSMVWRGRLARDPDAPGELMCLRPDAVSDAHAAGVRSVQKACCSSKGKMCDAFSQCGTQKLLATRADLWIVPHDLIYMRKPAELGELAALIVDEAAWQDGIAGSGESPIKLSLDSLDPSHLPGGLAMQELALYRSTALAALRTAPDAPLLRDAMVAAGLTAHGAKIAKALEWQRYVDPKMYPGMPAKERKAAKLAASGNATIKRLVAFWEALEHLLAEDGPRASGHLALATETTEDGPVRVLRMKWRKTIPEGWRVPTLIMDATLDMQLIRPFWPQAELVADINIETPHQHVWQVTDSAFTPTRYIPSEKASNKEKARCKRNLRDLRAIIAGQAYRVAPGRVLAVFQLDVEKALIALGPLPANVSTAHHNAVAGRNDWSDVRLLIVVGRTQPKPFHARLAAEAISGVAVEHDDSWYPRTDAVREMADGTLVAAEADQHPDALCEAVRWQACEGQLVQIVGRPRGVNRTAANPVDVLMLTDAPLPIPLAGTLSAADLVASATDLMLAEGGIALKNARHAAAAFSELWFSHTAATKALLKPRSLPFPYKDITNRGMADSSLLGDELVRVEYQVAGPGSKPAVAWCDLERVPDPAAFLEAALKVPLAWCRVGEGEPKPPGRPPPPPRPMAEKPPERPRPPPDAAPAPVEPLERVRPDMPPASPPWPAPGSAGWTVPPPGRGSVALVNVALGKADDG